MEYELFILYPPTIVIVWLVFWKNSQYKDKDRVTLKFPNCLHSAKHFQIDFNVKSAVNPLSSTMFYLTFSRVGITLKPWIIIKHLRQFLSTCAYFHTSNSILCAFIFLFIEQTKQNNVPYGEVDNCFIVISLWTFMASHPSQ